MNRLICLILMTACLAACADDTCHRLVLRGDYDSAPHYADCDR